MGWAFATNADGREVGYGIDTECDQEGCDKAIDRGLAYVCGSMHDGGSHGCGKYFCYAHLFVAGGEQVCGACYNTEYVVRVRRP